MKRSFTLILFLLITTMSLFAEKYSYPMTQEIFGYMNTMNDISIELDEAVLPFNILSSAVAKNENVSLVKGLKIGAYTMSSNDDTFSLKISHDKLKSDEMGLDGNYSYLDYRLDLFYGKTNSVFISCYSDQPIYITKNLNPSVFNSVPYIIAQQSIYVSMNETPAVLNAAADGTYSSTIKLELSVGQ